MNHFRTFSRVDFFGLRDEAMGVTLEAVSGAWGPVVYRGAFAKLEGVLW
jgi:hypothetical protein